MADKLTDERLAEIERDARAMGPEGQWWPGTWCTELLSLLAEVREGREREARAKSHVAYQDLWLKVFGPDGQALGAVSPQSESSEREAMRQAVADGRAEPLAFADSRRKVCPGCGDPSQTGSLCWVCEDEDDLQAMMDRDRE